MKNIYTVATLYIVNEKIKRDRTVGWFQDKEKAIQCIRENWGDIYECGYYNYALVEKISEGLYNIGGAQEGLEESWFTVEPIQDEEGCVRDYNIEETNKPDFLDKVINFSMG